MKRTDYHPFRRFWLPMLLACCMLTMVSCASDDAPSDGEDTVGVSLAFDVSVLRGDTRMSDAVTQQPNTPYLGLLNLYLFPFDVEGVIGSGKTPLSGNVFRPYQINGTYHYMDDKTLDIRVGTASFLCYARSGYESSDADKSDWFKYGHIKSSSILESVPNTSNISFEPEKIYTDQTTVDGNVIPAVHAKAAAIATYLTDVANAIKDQGKSALYQQFISNGHPVACSSNNVDMLKAWVTNEPNYVDLSSVNVSYANDYPANIKLPDGAAVVKWNETDNKFEPWTVTTTEVNINRLDRFIYPVELWYYANSRIKTSAKSQKENYNLSDWSKVLDKYENNDAVVDVNVKSVAIKDPLSYAVGCLRIGLVAKSALDDADGTTISLSAGTSPTFPLTAVFVSGQHAQSYDFTAKNDDEKIIYDKEITGISMGTATTASLSTATPTAYTNTLVFQAKDGENIRFALEFENNSGQDFKGCNGIVFAGTKFYLVGTIEVPVGQTDDWKKRAFTKGYTTQGTVRISSLKQAYTYLPDLLDPRLEIGIKLIPNWILSTPTVVPL